MNQFLESSSIHGLNHIATTKTLSRLFWVVTVTLGFILAGVLISKSFQRPVSSQHTFDPLGIFRILITNSNVYWKLSASWSDSPVYTSLSTHSISELNFPKITVCPPQDSLTSLNQDIVKSKDKVLTHQQKKELTDFVSEVTFDCQADKKFRQLRDNTDTDTYRHWYNGLTQG